MFAQKIEFIIHWPGNYNEHYVPLISVKCQIKILC